MAISLIMHIEEPFRRYNSVSVKIVLSADELQQLNELTHL